ncbi:MAG: hypothetical protein GY810_00795 [Aureispira sp.]|nr:hypothetical protein [Aureispira sp.]
MKAKKLLPSIIFLLIVNLIPMYGALVLGWDIFEIVLSYCLETFAIGILHVFKMMAAGEGGALKFFMVPFFIIHYNMFVIIQTIFVVVFMTVDFSAMNNTNGKVDIDEGHFDQFINDVTTDNWWWFPIILAISHLFSFLFNFIGKKEYKTKNVGDMMMAPYGRIIVQQITVIGGAFLMGALGSPIGLLLILIVMKTGLDLKAHVKEHEEKNAPENSLDYDKILQKKSQKNR